MASLLFPRPLIVGLLFCNLWLFPLRPVFAFSSITTSKMSFQTTGDDFQSFCSSIGLSDEQASGLKPMLGTNSDNSSDAALQIACQTAQVSLGTEQVNISPLNQTVVEENWSTACVQEPYCIFLPRNASEVSRSIRIISYFKVKFAVRAGGHSPNRGWSSVGEDGILVDLQRINQVTVSGDNEVASVGPGARWGDVQETVGAYNVSVVGGRTPSVGVGGLVLGGGYFHLSPQYGLAADNVNNFEIVLSNGSIVNANTRVNPDLFWALKGGGPNFGIVTRYDLNTIPVGEVWYQLNVYSTDQAPDVLEAVANWQANAGSSDPEGNIGLIVGLESVTLALIYGKPQDSLPETFSVFNELVPLQVALPATNGTFQQLNAIADSLASSAAERHDYRGVGSLVDAQLYKDVYSFWKERASAVYNATGANQTFVIQHVPASLVAAGIANGGNAMGIPEQTQQWWTTLVDWTDASQDDLVRSVAIDTTAKWEQLSQERGLNITFSYMNDAARDQNPIASYGAANVDRLKEIALEYDAMQLFQKQQNAGFLLSHV